MNKFNMFVLAAFLMFALAFTLSSCISDDGGDDNDDTKGGVSSSSSSGGDSSSSSSECTSADNSDSHYCSNGTLKEYGSVTDDYGQTYKTVVIGTQTWMAENLNYKTPSGSYCYDELTSNCNKYGRLYDWITAMDIDADYNNIEWTGSDVKHQGVCPDDWHLPSNADWEKLLRFVDNSMGSKDMSYEYTVGYYLKATNGWKLGDNDNGVDIYAFSALPGGYRTHTMGDFNRIGVYGYWWSSSGYNDSYNANYIYMENSNTYAMPTSGFKTNSYSVRCIKD